MPASSTCLAGMPLVPETFKPPELVTFLGNRIDRYSAQSNHNKMPSNTLSNTKARIHFIGY